MPPLSDDELEAYHQWAEAERDLPLLQLVTELQQRRAEGDRLAVVVLAPNGTRLPRLEVRGPCTLETYDPGAMHELRELLRKHGIHV